MMSGKSCFFVGHSDASDSLFPILKHIIRQHIVQFGVGDFLVGRYGNFDRMAMKAVIELKADYPWIGLTWLLPYHPAERPVKIPHGIDGTYYPPGMEKVPRRVAIVRANRFAVDQVDYLIAYAWQPGSNSMDLVECALRRPQVRVTLIGKDLRSTACII